MSAGAERTSRSSIGKTPPWLSATRLGAPFVLALVVLGSCGSDSEPVAEPSSPAAKAGQVVYTNSCAACHGLELEGTDRGPSHLSIVYEPGHHGDDAFRMAIANGAPLLNEGDDILGQARALDALYAAKPLERSYIT